MAKEKPPIFGMWQRGGAVVIRMLANVQQVRIGPLIERTIAKGALVYTDEYDIYSRLIVDFPTNGGRGVNGYPARSYSTGDR